MKSVRPKSVSLSDVANHVGLSRASIAKVLNNTGGDRVKVSEATAMKIRKAARELNYRPNLAARQLVGKRAKLIAVVVDTYAGHSMALTLASVEDIVSRNGYRLMVGYTHDSYERIQEHVDDFHSRGVDGVICMAYTYPGQYDAIEKLFAGFEHCVFLGSKPFSSGAAYIGINQHKVCEIAAEHLLGHSRKRIALMMPTALENYADNFKRFVAGYVQAHKNAGVAVDERLYQCMRDIMVVDLPAASRCLKSALALNPDALIAPSDEAAIWYMKALREHGLSVPGNIAIVSLEHWSIGQGITPSLTSIDYQSAELAKEATLMLFGMINNPQAQKPAGKMVDPRLVMGQSCGCNKAATAAPS